MFYINNNLVYIFTDTAASSGSVGLGMATLQGATSTTYNVDWATLSQYLGPSAQETISPEQQAFNEAGKNNPTDSLTPEKGRPLQP
jgi:hypothetical protein